jgi:hypothetical protein
VFSITEPDFQSDERVYLVALQGAQKLLEEKLSDQNGSDNTKGEKTRFLRLEYEGGEVRWLQITNVREELVDTLTRIRLECGRMRLDRNTLEQVEYLTEQGWRPLKRPVSDLDYYPASAQTPCRLEFPAQDVTLGAEDVLRLSYEGGHNYLLVVADVDWYFREDGQPFLLVRGKGLWQVIPPAAVQGRAIQVDLLKFDLFIREGRDVLEVHRGLSFNPKTPRDENSAVIPNTPRDENSAVIPNTPRDENSAVIPVDQRQERQILRLPNAPADYATEDEDDLAFWQNQLARPLQGHKGALPAADLLKYSTRLHIPGESGQTSLFLPLDMGERTLLPQQFEGPLADDEGAHDGLDSFSPVTMFLDPAFVGHNAPNFPAAVYALANDLFYLSYPLRPLTKLHSLFAVDEVALIAIPDLGHRQWQKRRKVRFLFRASEPVKLGKSGEFDDCEPKPAIKRDYGLYLRRQRLAPRIASTVSTEVDLYQRLEMLPEINTAWEPCESTTEVLEVHRAMINLAAGRGDMMAILSLPYRFTYHDVLDWHKQLTEYYADDLALSFAAAYHGWTDVREEFTPQLLPIRTIPPDGTICGMIAAREQARGPGVAPANEILHAVVGLDPFIPDDLWEPLFNRQINVLHRRPGRFVTLSAYTLSQHPLFLQISIRRMLMFIKKLVLREGYRYVFESNNERFRRAVQERFERIFNRMLEGGSLMGYEIDASDRINTPYEVDQGRFMISIRFALTYPVEYITIVLLRSGEAMLEVLER